MYVHVELVIDWVSIWYQSSLVAGCWARGGRLLHTKGIIICRPAFPSAMTRPRRNRELQLLTTSAKFDVS